MESSAVAIRPAQVADAGAIAEIHVQTWRDAYRGIVPDAHLDALSRSQREEAWGKTLAEGTTHVLVAETEGRVVGWIAAGPSRDPDARPGTGELHAIYIDSRHWRRGVGRLLWQRAEAHLRAQGFAIFTLWVLEENAGARAFYQGLGFGEDRSGRKAIALGGRSLVEMRYTLPAPPSTRPADKLVLPTREGYDLWSAVYDDDGNPLTSLEEPHVDHLLQEVRALRVLDVGCGTGRHAVRLAARGAQVTAIDFSTGMLAGARRKPGAGAVTFLEHDLALPLPLPPASFDRVLCCLVLDHVADLPAFFAQLRRVCRPGGFVVTSVMHPAMELRGVQARFHDPTTGAEVRPASVSHVISDYVMAALGAGLRPVEMSEHAVDAALVARAPRAARYLGWPLLLMMKLAVESGPE